MKNIPSWQFSLIIVTIIINIFCLIIEGFINLTINSYKEVSTDYFMIGLHLLTQICLVNLYYGFRKIFFKYKWVKRLINLILISGIIHFFTLLFFISPNPNMAISLLMGIPYFVLILGVLAFNIIIMAHPDRKKPIFKLLKMYCILDICGACFLIILAAVIKILSYYINGMSDLSFTTYFTGIIPYLFLIKYFVQLKKMVPEILLDTDTN